MSRLHNVRDRGTKITARCPACAESGSDNKGEHLVINAEGGFACVVFSGDSADAKEHRKRIFALRGDRQPRPLCVNPASGLLGRLGRVDVSPSIAATRETGLLGRLGRLFESQLSSPDATPCIQSPGHASGEFQTAVLSVLKPVEPVKPYRPLSKGEILLLRQAGAENDPLIITALNFFRGRIVAAR